MVIRTSRDYKAYSFFVPQYNSELGFVGFKLDFPHILFHLFFLTFRKFINATVIAEKSWLLFEFKGVIEEKLR